ncbi:MAG: protein kinase [Wenzhouxiangellaceae bacterium]|nr:protein kinase [Wenzhouxiangellaceae bacterium]
MAKQIGNYEIISELGRGGMGVVYKAREESLQRYVAIKMLGSQLTDNDTVAERFMREARAVADLNHPNLVQVFRVDRHEDQPYFAMEYVEGESLKALIQREKKMQPMRAVQILKEVANGLAAAHDKGVVHRDIKPENIMLTRYGGVKVVDFGIARMDDDTNTRLTTTGIGLGTPSYLSPEVCLSQDVDGRSDIFSLGVVLFEMLTGDTPFKSDSPFELMTKVVEANIPDIKELNPDVDDNLKKILAKMIAKRPKLRYQHCNELISDLEDYTAGRVPRYARDAKLETAPIKKSASRSETLATAPTRVVETGERSMASGGGDGTGSGDGSTGSGEGEAGGEGASSGAVATEAVEFDSPERPERRSGRGKLVAAAALLALVVVAAAVGGTLFYTDTGRALLADWGLAAPDGIEETPVAALVDSSTVSPAAPAADDEGDAGPAAEGSDSVEADAATDQRGEATMVDAVEPASGSIAGAVADPAGADERVAGVDSDEAEQTSESAASSGGFRIDVDEEAAAVASDAASSDATPADTTSETAVAATAGDDAGTSSATDSTARTAAASVAEPVADPVVDAGPVAEEASGQPIAAAATAPARPERRGMPRVPRVVVVTVGDPAVAVPLEEELEAALNRESIEMLDEQLMFGVADAPTLADVVAAVSDAGADLLVFADVVPTGERELNYVGRREIQRLAQVEARLVNVHERRNLGPLVRERLEYVPLTADREARDAAQPVARKLLARLREARANRRDAS